MIRQWQRVLIILNMQFLGKEAGWAGRTEGMTAKALESCATGAMWEVYEPTPMTRQY